jgi:fucose permease
MTLTKQPLIDKDMIVPFWLLTSCFIVWGLAQDLTAPLVTAFKGIFTMTPSRRRWCSLPTSGPTSA